MIIKSINIVSFAGLKNLNIEFTDNINLIFGNNGSGKSTIMNFIKLMLYGKTGNERSADISKSLRKRTKPLDGTVQQGSITILHNNSEYHIQKKFGKTYGTDEIIITNLTTGENVVLDTGVEPGEYFTGLSISQFERCCYIQKSDYSNLETELTDIKDFSPTEDNTAPSSSGTALGELNKRKEIFISKSKKKGLIVEKEAELNSILSEIEKSLENEILIKKLDKEFNNVKAEIEKLNEYLKNTETAEKVSVELNSLSRLLELKKQLEFINLKIFNLGMNENELKEYLYLGDVLLQNTLTRFRMTEEIKMQYDYADFEKTKQSRDIAIKSSEIINNENQKINLLRVILEKKLDLKLKHRKKRISFYTTLCLSIFSIIFFILYYLTNNTNIPYLIVFALILDTISFMQLLLTKKNILKLKKTFSESENKLSIDEITANLTRSEDNLYNLSSELENLYLENKVNSFEELTEKYYMQKTEIERSDVKSLKNTALESSKKFILHINRVLESNTFEEAQENFKSLKELYNKLDSLGKEYDNLLKLTSKTDKTVTEYEEQINKLNLYLKSSITVPSKDRETTEKNILNLTEKLLNIKGEYPRESKSIYELRQTKDLLTKELNELKDTYNAILMAEELLNESFNEISWGFIPKLNKEASSILSKLENISEKELIVTDNAIPKVKQDITGEFIHSAYMSESEKERIYLALRLAIISVIENNREKLPIIADDIFSSYDRLSKENSIDFLKKFSTERQVIFFTCHDSVKNIFKDSENINLLNI